MEYILHKCNEWRRIVQEYSQDNLEGDWNVPQETSVWFDSSYDLFTTVLVVKYSQGYVYIKLSDESYCSSSSNSSSSSTIVWYHEI